MDAAEADRIRKLDDGTFLASFFVGVLLGSVDRLLGPKKGKGRKGRLRGQRSKRRGDDAEWGP